jgi:hypothetical protein
MSVCVTFLSAARLIACLYCLRRCRRAHERRYYLLVSVDWSNTTYLLLVCAYKSYSRGRRGDMDDFICVWGVKQGLFVGWMLLSPTMWGNEALVNKTLMYQICLQLPQPYVSIRALVGQHKRQLQKWKLLSDNLILCSLLKESGPVLQLFQSPVPPYQARHIALYDRTTGKISDH